MKNVKSFSVLNSTFAHIPQVGIYVERTGQLEIKDNIFIKVNKKCPTQFIVKLCL